MLTKSTWWRMRFWMACCAILLNALAPSISHALDASRGYTPAAEICSADGSYGANEQGWHLLADCAYCLQHGASDPFTPPDTSVAGLVDGHGRQAFLQYQAPRPVLARTARCARGPPSL